MNNVELDYAPVPWTGPINVGDVAKVGFVIPAELPGYRSEWMFCEITFVNGEPPNEIARGELLNTPVFIPPWMLAVGAEVEFGRRHVYSSEPDERKELGQFDDD